MRNGLRGTALRIRPSPTGTPTTDCRTARGSGGCPGRPATHGRIRPCGHATHQPMIGPRRTTHMDANGTAHPTEMTHSRREAPAPVDGRMFRHLIDYPSPHGDEG